MPKKTTKTRELLEEFRMVLGKVGLLDTILPPVLFLALNRWVGFNRRNDRLAGVSILIAVLRLSRKQSLLYTLAGTEV